MTTAKPLRPIDVECPALRGLLRKSKRMVDLLSDLRPLVATDDTVAVMDRLKAHLKLPPYRRRLAARAKAAGGEK